MELDRNSEVPVGVQLAWALRAAVTTGELARGARLPGLRELAAETGVNVNTIRAVYARLAEDGLVVSVQGRGTFVAGDAPVDERLAAVRRRVLADARVAGLDPREVAAALWPVPVAAGPGPGDPRAALRAEIAALERELSDERYVRALAARAPERRGAFAGPRIPSDDELRAIRDDLAARLASLRAAPEPPATAPATAPAPAAAPAPAPGVGRLRTAFQP